MEIIEKNWQDLTEEKIDLISSSEDKPEVIFPGSFNPLHEGHIAIRDYAEKFFEKDVFFEICIQNADKPQLSYESVVATVNNLLILVGLLQEQANLQKNLNFFQAQLLF